MKTCIKCKQEKSLENFRWKNKSKEQKYNYCIPCHKEYEKERYAATAERKRLLKKNVRRNYKEKIFNLLALFLLEHPCVECGETDIRLLQFDHLRDKEDNIADLIRCSFSWENILKEIEKCQVLCVKCHTIKTLVESNSYKLRMFDKYQRK